jgi:transcriptional regulator
MFDRYKQVAPVDKDLSMEGNNSLIYSLHD